MKKIFIVTINFNLETCLQQKTKRFVTSVHENDKIGFLCTIFCSPVQQSNKEVYFSYNGSPCDLEAKNTSISFLVIVNSYSPRWKLIVNKAQDGNSDILT